MKKSKKAYLSRRQAVSKEGFATQLERNIADLKNQCAYEIARFEKAQAEANKLEARAEIIKKDIRIFESNKAAFESKAHETLLKQKAERQALDKQKAELSAYKRRAEELMREAQGRIEAAEQMEKRLKK